MSTTSIDPVITSYAKAPARTITAGGVNLHETFAPVAVEFLGG